MDHQPGLESITKQFLYQSAYREFITENHFDKVANVFLVPTEKDKPSLLARVSFSEVMEKMDKPFSNFIYMWALPAKEIFECYLYNYPLKKKLTKKIANSDEYFTN